MGLSPLSGGLRIDTKQWGGLACGEASPRIEEKPYAAYFATAYQGKHEGIMFGPQFPALEPYNFMAQYLPGEPKNQSHVNDGVLTACIGQKRGLFTYMGVKALHDYVHSPLQFSADDRAAGIVPIPVQYNTGTYTVTRDNVDLFLRQKG